ncbi:sugar porter family MFS transporter [Candidatus Kirkpatrickella diaphorinae]|uniref:Sugar porter family MFS transporter n=1 Tax=Candidatus Kirkpatrickella diaphorinae TaxID=2984322 RepID=A0ABY6GKE4_9PROT|nr:sugar porter family MFS transporter [Candidatus Kirkpatrickella diaphorinae]UYH51121.1 sugar porter family MFS transporter [Candidatus Kirkpatrickella diaphorinae]
MRPDDFPECADPASFQTEAPQRGVTSADFRVFIASCVAGLAGLLFGYDQGIISAALLTIEHSFPLSLLGKQAVAASMVAGALLGCLIAGPVSDRWGRRPVVALAGLIFLLGSVGSGLAASAWHLTGARFILGIAVGGASQIVPVYIAELAPAPRRGRLVLMFQLAIVSGILISSLIGWLLSGHAGALALLGRGGDWRLMFFLGSVPAVMLLMGVSVLPESPRYLAMRGQAAAAMRVLRRLRDPQAAPEDEMREILSAAAETGNWRTLFSRRVRPALIAGAGLAMFSQMTGTNAVLTYAPTILSGAGFGHNVALLTSLGMGVAITLATILGVWAVDRLGRRRLMLCVLPGSIFALFLLAAVFLHGDPQNAGRWLAIIGLLLYVLCTLGSINAALWLVGAEIFPLSVRGKSMSLVTISHWSFDFLVSMVTLSIIAILGVSGTFLLFALITVSAWVFIYARIPETKNRSLEAIEESLSDGTFLHHR